MTFDLRTLPDHVGQELGLSRWISVDQDRISAFADTTLDHQYIHTDPERAAQTPLGGTIAHGFLPLSLLSVMLTDVLGEPAGMKMSMNYGFDHLRFVSPVKSGARLRGRFRLEAVDADTPGRVKLRLATQIEIENAAKPALVATWLVMLFSQT